MLLKSGAEERSEVETRGVADSGGKILAAEGV